MENISITTYRGFSKVKGRCSLNELIEKVRSSRYAALIEKIGRLISEGKTKEAENVKRQAGLLHRHGKLPRMQAGA